MANPAVSLVSYQPAKAGSPGVLVVDATWTTYAQNTDALVLTGLRLPGFEPRQVVCGWGAVGTTGHQVTFTPSATPTMSNVGILRAWNGTTQVASGAFAQTARLSFVLSRGG
jgi:hypothetical protein